MKPLNPAQLKLLEMIGQHDGEWNWYKVARAAFDLFSDNPGLKFSDLDGLIREEIVEGEQLPRMWLTEAGRAVLSDSSQYDGDD
ncbi:MAG: hypothetical protein WD066_20490 [Planctomycetaceae bacterium]